MCVDNVLCRLCSVEKENTQHVPTIYFRNELIVFQGPDDHAGTSTDNP